MKNKCPHCDKPRTYSQAYKNKLNKTCTSPECLFKERSLTSSKNLKKMKAHPWRGKMW